MKKVRSETYWGQHDCPRENQRDLTCVFIVIVSVSISECACGCGKDDVSTGPPLLTEKRDAPPPYYGQLEDVPSEKPGRSFTYVSDETILRRGAFKDGQLPSGLSVEDEDEPELETTIL